MLTVVKEPVEIQPSAALSTYKLVIAKSETEGCENETVYGIEVVEVSEHTIRRAMVPDISASRTKIEELLGKIERHRVGADFLREIVEDYLEEQYSVQPG